MLLVYKYTNGQEKIHKSYIAERTMIREGKGSDRVEIYKLTNLDLYDEGLDRGIYNDSSIKIRKE